jgi:hypothetical protein
MSGAISASRPTIVALLAPITAAVERGGELEELEGGDASRFRDALDAARTILGLVEASEREFERLARIVERAEPDNAALALEIEAKKGGPAAPLFRAMAQRLSPARLAAGHGRAL